MMIWNYITVERVVALISALGVIVTVWSFEGQLAMSRFALGVELLGKMDERFNSQEMFEKRRAAATALLKKKDYGEVDDVLDFFETMGLMLKRGALDEEMVWNTFFYWVDGYWRAAQPYIQSERREDPVVWSEVEYLNERCDAFEKRKLKGQNTSEVPVQEFLTYEAQLSDQQEVNQRQKGRPRRRKK